MQYLRSHRVLFISASLLLCIVSAAFTVWLLERQAGSNDSKHVLVQVGRHYVLPADEEPAILTVTDTRKLTTDFLKQTKNGDKVLVYQRHRKAIIYRPDIDKIVDIGPVAIDQPPTRD